MNHRVYFPSLWRRRVRLLFAAIAVGCAVSVAFVIRSRGPVSTAAVAATDPSAVVESAGGRTIRINREREQVRIEYERLLAYADGSSKMVGVKVVTERAGGRVFTITGREGQVGQNESTLAIAGDVTITASDGLVVRSEHATFAQADGITKMPGEVEFSRGRLTGTSTGLVYDKGADVLTLLDRPVFRIAAEAGRASRMDIVSGSAEFRRMEQLIRFERGLKALRATDVIEAEAGVARLADDSDAAGEAGDRLEVLELRGAARILAPEPAPGAYEAITGRDIDVRYAADGQTIERVAIVGGATLRLAGEDGRAGTRVAADAIDLTLAADGATPVGLSATRNVQMTLPEEGDRTIRTITANVFEAKGEGSRGLSAGHFSGEIEFRERGPMGNRTVRSDALDVALAPGLQSLEEARFARSVKFTDGSMNASAARARYVLRQGSLELAGAEPGLPAPRVLDRRLAVEGTDIAVTLSGPHLKAVGNVKSELYPASEGTKTPSMLKRDQPVIITADNLIYDGEGLTAEYAGGARLSQGDTTVRGDTIALDQELGDMRAAGSVVTTALLEQTTKDGRKERVPSIARAKEFAYLESARRGTYTGDARVSGEHGDLRARRVELFLDPSGQELERLEAYDDVVLVEQGRKTTGARLTYLGGEERYEVTGTPLTVVDECRRETTGRTLTFDRTTDRIVVDGSQMRTRTKGASECP